MKLQTFLFVGMIVELCLVPLLDAKRSFGITRSRNKNKGPSVRRNQHGHEDFDSPAPVPPAHPKPSAPEMRKPVSSQPVGPPAYPGMGHHNPPPYGAPAPPAYGSSNYGSPPAYSSGMGYNQPRFNQPGSFNQPNQYGSGMQMGGGMPMGGMMPMGGGMMGGGMMGGGYNRGGGSGIMTNLFAGLAGYQLARAFSGGHGHRDREVIVINNSQPGTPDAVPAVPNANPDQAPSLSQPSEPQSNFNTQHSTEIPQEPVPQVGPTMNEYNYYGIPQYGIPLYGYSLPSQITDYYQTAIVAAPQEAQQPSSEK